MIESIPTIPDRTLWDACHDTCDKYWRTRRSWIICGITSTVLLIIVGVIIILQPKSSNYPCLTYDQNSLASTVTVECLQYAWNMMCQTKSPYTFPQGYTGWWRQSPQGITMVSCITSPGNCGVGTYGNIVVYMQTCKININQ